jgi:hypothetical protein
MLIVGGVSVTHRASASMLQPCPHAIVDHHRLQAPGSDQTPGGNDMHCLTLAGICCAVAQSVGMSVTATVVQAMVIVWDATPADGFFGQCAKVATPPPRS